MKFFALSFFIHLAVALFFFNKEGAAFFSAAKKLKGQEITWIALAHSAPPPLSPLRQRRASAPADAGGEKASAVSSGGSGPRGSSGQESWHTPPPLYPESARLARREGEVLVRFTCGAEGLVEESRLERSSGDPELDQAALAAVSTWRLSPFQKGLIPIRFTLQES